MRNMTLLEFIETFPQLENDIRSFDKEANSCLLCECLFDELKDIEKSKNINFDRLYKKARHINESNQ